MTTHTFDVYYLGVLGDIDPDESDYASENADDLVGSTFGDAANPISHNLTELTAEDTTGDGYVASDDAGQTAEYITYDGTAAQLDSTVEYWVTITYVDGSTATTEMMVIQDVDGRTFLSPLQTGDSQNDPLDDAAIQSISLDSVSWDDAGDMYVDPESHAFIVCFAGGTLIETEAGPVEVGKLQAGDRVRTMDHGLQPIRWIGGRRVRAAGRLAPIRIAAGALGGGLPRRDLLVSPQHRVLVRSRVARRMFGVGEVLVAAKKLVGLAGIRPAPGRGHVTYWHMLFQHHEIVFSEGAATESLYPGPMALRGVGAESRAEILTLFPALEVLPMLEPARFLAEGRACNNLVARHVKNQRRMRGVGLMAACMP